MGLIRTGVKIVHRTSSGDIFRGIGALLSRFRLKVRDCSLREVYTSIVSYIAKKVNTFYGFWKKIQESSGIIGEFIVILRNL